MAAPYRPKPSGFKPNGKKPNRPFPNQKKDENELNINQEITAPQVRLVGDNIPEPGIYPLAKALALADQMELDLVEISAKADPPVCKILDYQKYLYQQKKKAKEMKSNSAKIVLKEIRFGPNTDEHDFQFKLKHAQEFLQEGSKVKATIFFRGRSIQFAEQGEKQLLRFAVELEEFGRAENMPVLEGKRMTMIIAPIKKK
ncbi:MAG: translation initiation factor IF-3 [Bacteroidales bacterium]|nr:translation initiation factor IF-3 [Bacteroidales bacterium]MBQ1905212.1 translation initiation factor IF-3 [Bacteroidales bacterium]MBQ2103867.1 translation initiation factor IF-3 [Bacteroidales bacterium]MBQ2501495.1 translation initiation factor IF-3 [Bacteroidales bacterium]MBQ3976647.1 translation initiation factor IF-3 [Bacteroidales bacterium]